MELSTLSQAPIAAGDEVTGLFGDARLRNALHFTVASTAPLVLEGNSGDLQKYAFPRSVVIVAQKGRSVVRGEGDAISVEKLPNGRSRIFFTKPTWEEVDRRQYPRINLALPVKIRAVYESGEDTVICVAEGDTIDVSVGGSKIRVDHSVLVGSLVEFDAALSEVDRIRALGVVVYSDSEGYLGISFMDYVGATRFKLSELTRFKAA